MQNLSMPKNVLFVLCLIITMAMAEIMDVVQSPLSTNSTLNENETVLPSDLPTFTLEQLRVYNGTNSSLPILLGLRGAVFDVTSGSKFYAPGKAYSNFAGRDVTRNTAMFSTKNRDLDRVDYPPDKQASLDSEHYTPSLSVRVALTRPLSQGSTAPPT